MADMRLGVGTGQDKIVIGMLPVFTSIKPAEFFFFVYPP